MLGVRDEVSKRPVEHHWRRWFIKHSDPDLTARKLATAASDLFPGSLECSLFHCYSRPEDDEQIRRQVCGGHLVFHGQRSLLTRVIVPRIGLDQ